MIHFSANSHASFTSSRHVICGYERPADALQSQEQHWRENSDKHKPAQSHQAFKRKGRITHTGNMECIHCNTDQYVVNVNTLGRIVRVYDISFYFCTTCLKVHQWQSSGQDLIECHKQEVKPTKRQTQCVFCEKTHGLDQIHLLNSDIGVSNSVLLCSKHMPCKFQLPYLTDFNSYWRAMNHKKQLFKK